MSSAITGRPTVRMPVLMLVMAAMAVKMEMMMTQRDVDRSGNSCSATFSSAKICSADRCGLGCPTATVLLAGVIVSSGPVDRS